MTTALLVVVALAVVAAALGAFAIGRRGGGWRALGRALGDERGGPTLAGTVGGVAITVRTEVRGEDRVTVVALAVPGLPAGLIVAPAGELDGAGPTGDPAFDARLRARAEGQEWAWLAPAARAALVEARGRLLDGELVVERALRLPTAVDLAAWAAVAAGLVVPDPVAALVTIARDDPSPVMQARALTALGALPGGVPRSLAEVTACRPGLAGAVTTALTGDDDRFAEALGLVDDAELAVLGAALADRPGGATAAAVARLVPRAAGAGPGAADAAMRALLRAGPSEHLVLQLFPAADHTLNTAADWLSDHGTAAAVPALDARAAATPAAAAALLQVKRAIQTRARGGPGAVSLAADTGGGLSLGVAAAGRLSER